MIRIKLTITHIHTMLQKILLLGWGIQEVGFFVFNFIYIYIYFFFTFFFEASVPLTFLRIEEELASHSEDWSILDFFGAFLINFLVLPTGFPPDLADLSTSKAFLGCDATTWGSGSGACTRSSGCGWSAGSTGAASSYRRDWPSSGFLVTAW